MEAYAISGANLDTIERNLGSVAKELSGVIENVSEVNDQITDVNTKVSTLDNEIKSLVKEIRETTFITSARQNIMYNNEQIEKKYGYYDDVRRRTLSIIDSINNSSIDKKSLESQVQKTLLNNPGYYLTNAYAALVYWVLDNKKECYKELDNALKKNKEKTKLFFLFINLKFNRLDVALRWLMSYLNDLNPLKLDYSFVEILELCVNDALGVYGKQMIISKIDEWMNILSTNNNINETEEDKWLEYITSKETRNLDTVYLDNYSPDRDRINQNLYCTSSYRKMLSELESIVNTNRDNISLDDIIKNVIYDYENEEKELEQDNFKNKLIIECNGDKKKAEELFEKQKSIYDTKVNIVSLFNNITIYFDRYNLSSNTRKFILCYTKKYIKKAYEISNASVVDKDINAGIGDFNILFDKNTDMNTINKNIDYYVNSKYTTNDKIMWIILVIVNLVGIVGIFFVSSNMILCTILVIMMIIGNIIVIYKLLSELSNIKNLKQNKKKELLSLCEIMYAENRDYKDTINDNNIKYKELIDFLEKLNINSFISSTERNIEIG